jgi:hypothetical protein
VAGLYPDPAGHVANFLNCHQCKYRYQIVDQTNFVVLVEKTVELATLPNYWIAV